MNLKHSLKFSALLVLTTFTSLASKAEDKILPHMDIAMDMRADWTYDAIPHEKSKSGFHGRYLNLHFNATIVEGLTFHWRQRLNKFKDSENDVFSATDWAYLRYQPSKNFAFSAGKEVLLIGGYEYDAAPIDIYFSSNFWNNIACYQFGASAHYISNNGKHVLTAQVSNSPYKDPGQSCYAYNLYWSGEFGCYHTLWSANLIEYERGHYATFLALGNRLDLGNFRLELDYMNRYVPRYKHWWSDYSLIAKAEYKVSPIVTLMVKGGKDDIHIIPGTPEHLNKEFLGGGIEIYPLRGWRNLRIHAIFDHTYHNDGTADNQINIGLKWRLDIFKK